jgi:hypothetical protein
MNLSITSFFGRFCTKPSHVFPSFYLHHTRKHFNTEILKITCSCRHTYYLSVSMFSVVKHLESANTMFSFIWWIVGFYWVSAGGQALSHDAPQLYWYACCNCNLMCE